MVIQVLRRSPWRKLQVLDLDQGKSRKKFSPGTGPCKRYFQVFPSLEMSLQDIFAETTHTPPPPSQKSNGLPLSALH